MDAPSITVDDVGPLSVRAPSSAAEVGDCVREAAATGQGIYPVGGRTALDLGLPPMKAGFALDTRGLNRIVDYPARDMTVTAESGVTLADLGRALAAENQWLPIDVPHPERATLGGAAAANASGPRRYGYGTLRDYVIGIGFTADDGSQVKAGGRVVKNVAGYDLMKLQVGALGTLGVLTLLTLKVRPKPEATALVNFSCEGAALGAILDLLHASKSRPVVVDFASSIRNGNSAWSFSLLFEEKKATVDWQASTLLAELKATSIGDVNEDRTLPAASWRPPTNDGAVGAALPLCWKANVRPSLVAEFCKGAIAASPETHLSAHGLNGIVYGTHAAGLSLGGASTMVETLSATATQAGGNLTIRRCPPEWKKALPIWGRPGGDRELMRHVKRTLDPKNVFNPGRLFGDI